ncbi:GNAT family N-acetyltransferase [Streptomyces sp. WMMB 322]|uniref:GNAT family N-acetyltransferase n=1 Tax=Streptomyces sp. WMMB 322 TaxID=1286821 RepID=UPI0006E15512|nr:GNAT family protein [Streptomyces sp. WMMB 322]SCK32438.1 Protein N-acetyltransferase, RimJ/RimL family [Streptomyces sp. WMMB 322]
MTPECWPVYGLRITTPRLVLRLPDLGALEKLAAVAAAGVHGPDEMPFSFPWTDGTPERRARTTFQHVLGTVAGWQPEKWTLSLAVLHEGEVVGRQDITARDFAVTKEAQTGSWLGLAHQNQGLGTEMRAAVTHLAFEGLGARALTSGAMTDNPRSLAVSRKLGYEADGVEVVPVRGEARTVRRLRLDRASWERHRSLPVGLHGLEPCLELFGAERG